jgi:electron transfer flavoprotein-quinone oxidoreductase
MPEIVADGLLVAGDAAGLCLAAGIWLEGVNFAIGSGAAAGEAAAEALRSGDTSAAGLAGYRRRLESSFVLRDHKKLRRAPGFVLSDRVQHRYPQVVCDIVEQLFTVENPRPKRGGIRAMLGEMRKTDLRLSEIVKDVVTAVRTFG